MNTPPDIKIVIVKLWKPVKGERYPHTKGKRVRRTGSGHKPYKERANIHSESAE